MKAIATCQKEAQALSQKKQRASYVMECEDKRVVTDNDGDVYKMMQRSKDFWICRAMYVNGEKIFGI